MYNFVFVETIRYLVFCISIIRPISLFNIEELTETEVPHILAVGINLIVNLFVREVWKGMSWSFSLFFVS